MSEEVLMCCIDLLGITVVKKNFESGAAGIVKWQNGKWHMGIVAQAAKLLKDGGNRDV